MAKPHCAACERLRLECVWPEIRNLLKDPDEGERTSLSESSTLQSLPIASTSRVQLSPIHVDPSLFHPPTERSAVDGLLDLFSANADGRYSDVSFPIDPSSISPQVTTVQSQPDQTPLMSSADALYDMNAFTFDDVSLYTKHTKYRLHCNCGLQTVYLLPRPIHLQILLNHSTNFSFRLIHLNPCNH